MTLFTDASAQNEGEAFWYNHVVPNIMSREFLSFDLFTDRGIPIHVDIGPTAWSVVVDSASKYFETSDSLVWFDLYDGACLYGNKLPFPDDTRPNIKRNNLAHILMSTGTAKMNAILPFYFQHKDIKSYQYTFKRIERLDSIHLAYHTEKVHYYKIDPSNGDTVQIIDSMTFVVDTRDAWIKQVRKANHQSVQNIIIGNMVFDVPTDIYGQIEDCRTRYKHFKSYNFLTDFPPNLVATIDETHEYKQSLFDFPLVSASGDSTTISRTPGWKLLDFWSYGCRYCFIQLKQFQEEKEVSGHRVLEEHNITLMCINPGGAVTDKFRKVADQYAAHDILFSAQGIGEHINIHASPYYVLISPDNTVVECLYKCDENYENVLNAMKKYQNQHPLAR